MIFRFKTISVFMSHLFFGWALVCLAQAEAMASAEVSEEVVLTLDSAVERLKAQSPRLLFERETVKRALASQDQVRSALLPHFSVTGQQTRQRSGNSYAVSPGQGNPNSSFRSRIEARQVLFDGVKYSELGAAKIAYDVAELDYAVLLEDLLELMAQLFYTQLRDLKQVEIIETNIERDQALLALARQQYDAGAAILLDVTRAEVRVATQRRILMQAQTQAQNSLLQLKSLLDFDLERSVRVDHAEYNQLLLLELREQDSEFLALAEQRPELRSQRQAVEQAEVVKQAAAWKRLPTLEAFGDWGYDSGEIFDDEEGEAWLVGIRASIPLFEGGRIAAQKREASAALRQSEYRLRELENELKREFHFTRIDMDSRYAQIEIAQEELRLGQAEVEQAEQRYREGLADNRELIDARQNLADAENSHLQAIYFYALSRLAFARATGDVARFFE